MKKVKQEKRPSSDSFVDVHIFIVPHELWMEKYRTAYNNSTLESISAGFVRVAPSLSLLDLRNQMKEQLGGDDIMPEDYVFLRCVGRCLAIVSKVQEFSLKVRHFLPPVVSAPEIFILFGTHESLSHSLTSSLNNGSDLPEYVRGYITYSREMDEGSRCSTQSTAGGEVSPEYNNINDASAIIERRQVNDASSLVERRQVNDASPLLERRQVNDASSLMERLQVNDASSLMERRQVNDASSLVERLQVNDASSLMERRQVNDASSLMERRQVNDASALVERRQVNDASALVERRQVNDASALLERRQVNDASSIIDGEHEELNDGTMSMKRHVHFEKHSEGSIGAHGDLNKDTVTENGIHNKGDTVRNQEQLKQKDIVENLRKITETYLTDLPQTSLEHQSERDYSRSTTLQSLQNTAKISRKEHMQEYPIEKMVNVQSNTSEQGQETTSATNDNKDKQGFSESEDFSKQSIKIKRKNPLIHSKTAPALFQNTPTETNEKDKEDLDKTETARPGKTNGSGVENEVNKNKEHYIKNNSADEDGEIRKKNKHNSNEPISTSATESTKTSSTGVHGSYKEISDIPTGSQYKENDLPVTMADKKNLILQLQAELHDVRNERSTSEKTREQLLKKAKNLQNQNNQKRTQARSIWKKRYFEEKKTTVSLEERCNQLRYEVDVLHKRLFSSMDSKDHDSKHEFVQHHDGDPDTVNNKILLSRKENEVEELKRRVEEAKIKLGSEMKLRDTAQKELKHIRDEVIDKKINATLVKKSLSLLETRPSNI